MANFIFNNVLGRERQYVDLPLTNDALVVVPLKLAGLEADETLRDYTDLSALLAGSSDEHPMGRRIYSSVAGATVVDNDNNRVRVPFGNSDWAGVTGSIGALLVCYDPDTTTGTDSTIVPITKHDFVVTGLDGTGNVTARLAVEGLIELRNA